MTGRVGDLTTLQNVKSWRSPALATTADDTSLQREITACSKFILNYLQRNLVTQVYTERRNGTGQCELMLRNRPIISVSSVQVYNTQVPSVNFGNQNFSGFTFDNNPDPVYNTGVLYLNGYAFSQGRQNIEIIYTAGLLINDEEVTIDSDSKVQCSSLFELWSAPWQVAYTDGTLLTPVESDPTVGQYVPALAPDGYYLFNDMETATPLLISYSYTPKDIEAACITTIILEFNRRSRIGEDSKSLAGETISYTKRGLSESTIDFLQSFIEVTPVSP